MPGDELAESLADLARGTFPLLTLAPMGFYTVVKIQGQRLEVRAVDRTEEAGLPDMALVEVWPGIPGAESVPAIDERVVVAFVGPDRYPVIIARGCPLSPRLSPRDVVLYATALIALRSQNTVEVRGEEAGSFTSGGPIEITSEKGQITGDAMQGIRLLGDLTVSPPTAKVRIGVGGEILLDPVAKSTPVSTYLTILEAWAVALEVVIAPLVATLTPPQKLAYETIRDARISAASIWFPLIPAQQLETR